MTQHWQNLYKNIFVGGVKFDKVERRITIFEWKLA